MSAIPSNLKSPHMLDPLGTACSTVWVISPSANRGRTQRNSPLIEFEMTHSKPGTWNLKTSAAIPWQWDSWFKLSSLLSGSQWKWRDRAGVCRGQGFEAGTLGVFRELERQRHPLFVIAWDPAACQEPKITLKRVLFGIPSFVYNIWWNIKK